MRATAALEVALVRATVLIPVKDGRAYLGPLLSALARQELEGGIEVVAVDSGSKDGSRELLAASGVRIVDVDPAAFDHGTTRNLGAREARGRTVVFLSQDALPVDGRFVRCLVEALEGDGRLAGAFARQAPRPQADPLTRRDLRAWVAGSGEPRVAFRGAPEAWAALPPLAKQRLCAFDNVASAVRRDLLLEHPFEATRFGEDIEWGQRMLTRGYGLAYVPEAVVEHSHRRTVSGLYRRGYLCHRLLFRLFGLNRVPGRRQLVRAVAGAVAGDLLTLVRQRSDPATWLAAPLQALASVYGEYRGVRDERFARPYPEWA